MIARVLLVAVVGAILAAQVVRNAAVAGDISGNALAARIWPSHPAVLVNQVMSEVGARARHGQAPAPATLRRVDLIARDAPLAPEPFLIRGALAQVAQRQDLAESLFTAARKRDPRSVAARYFLADRYLRSGRVAPALAEVAVLSRLFPQSQIGFGPALATFAHTPGAAAPLRDFFRKSPQIEPLVLSTLAEDGRNADLILSLWPRTPGADAAQTAAWQSKLINKLIEQGDYAKAYATWRRVAGVAGDPATLFNPGFAQSAAPPPFNWTLAAAGGVVEPAPGDRLQVIYYGRGDAVLAEQLLLLAPGRYRLSMEVSDAPGAGGQIGWTMTCVPGGQAILHLAIEAKGGLGATFAVPPGCAAQRLQLKGVAGDFPQSQEFVIARLGLARVAGG